MTSQSRRQFIAVLAATGGATLAGCTGLSGSAASGPGESAEPRTYEPPEPEPLPEPAVRRTLRAADEPQSADSDRTRGIWTYEGRYPGPELRVAEGDVLEVKLKNDLSASTTAHWHGVPLQNAMDGVPAVTQDPVEPGSSFTYSFRAEPAGTYFYHSHVGLQLDRGLFGPLIVEEADPHVDYDREFVVVFDDYLDRAPEPLSGGGGGSGGMGGSSGGRGGMGGRGSNQMGDGTGGSMGGMDVRPPYAGLTANGRLPSSPPILDVEDGERVRFRFLNAASATEFRTRLAGHRMQISHVDGRPVDPVTVDEFVFGPGERYDAVVEMDAPGAWALLADAVGGAEPPARVVVRYAESERTPRTPDWGAGRRLQYGWLRAREPLPVSGSPDRFYDLTLSRAGGSYTWLIDGQAYPHADPLAVREGEHVRFRMTNHSPVAHPMHLHGHFFRVGDALMDTVRVPGHMGQVSIDFRADNPGNWLFHCHNLYHLESGMARVVSYV